MRWKNGDDHYGVVSIFFHWTLALAMLGLIGLGAWMVELSYYDRWYNEALAWHKGLGIIVFVVVVLKLGWHSVDRKPRPEPALRPLERVGSMIAHALLNLALVLVPVSGYVISTSAGASIDVFGWFEVPAMFDSSTAVRDGAIAVHTYVAYAVLAVVLVHAGAALKHHFVDRGVTLRRMLVPNPPPRPRERSPGSGRSVSTRTGSDP